MASQRGRRCDLWADVQTPEEEGQEEDINRIAVVYRRQRTEDPEAVQINQSDRRETRISLALPKRTSWNRSLSTRGRKSIIVAAGFDSRHYKQRGGKKRSNQGPNKKKLGQQDPPDFQKERAYFDEVDSFELLEESPSPKHFGVWTMGTKSSCIVHDLPAILARWRISKFAYSCGSSGPLLRIMETPIELSCSNISDISNEKIPEGTSWPGEHLKTSSGQQSTTSNSVNVESVGNSKEGCILSSLETLHITEDTSELVGALVEGDVDKDLRGGVKKNLLDFRLSLGAECENAFTQLLTVCRQSVPLTLSEVFSQYCDPSNIFKIGEGTYGEVFKAGASACKVVPIDGDLLVNGEVQKRSGEVLEEVLLSLTLENLRGQEGDVCNQNACTTFIETKNFHVCQGAYSVALISAWEDWDRKHGSENDHPKEFHEKQFYIVFVLADGGSDLESFVLLNFDEARSVLVQVTATLAVAEAACEFEHRDLHWGNILLTRKEDPVVEFTIEGRKLSARTFGLTISIIDFTFSRIKTGEAILFLDLSADPGLFEGQKGDKQSETYRKMKEVTEEYWERSFPKTNVLWLQYLVDILLLKKSFKRTMKDERDLRSFKKRLNSYGSSKDSLADPFFVDLFIDQSL